MNRNIPQGTLILLVEDNEDDAFLIQSALKNAGITNTIHLAKTGEDAIAYLAGTAPYTDWNKFPLPSILLLDLRLPGLSGFDVLTWIRKTPGLQTLRVAILTGSSFSKDFERAYELGANGCFPKLGSFNELIEMMKSFHAHWLEHSRAPEVSRPPPQTT